MEWEFPLVNARLVYLVQLSQRFPVANPPINKQDHHVFTGIIEEVGTVSAIQRGAQSARLAVSACLVADGTRVGDSIAVNGVCLTVVEISGNTLAFDAVPETVQRTSLRIVRVGDLVNLERALAVGDRLGGHMVQGHVDGAGVLEGIRPAENADILTISAPPELMRYIAPKGSVAVDGISLTVVDALPDRFTVSIIPHTRENTTLRFRNLGDPVNIETDVLAKYVERLMGGQAVGRSGGPAATLTFEKLAASGFVTAPEGMA